MNSAATTQELKKIARANMHLPNTGLSSTQYKKALAEVHNESYSRSTVQKRFARILSETAKGLDADGVLRVREPVTSKVLATKCTDGSDVTDNADRAEWAGANRGLSEKIKTSAPDGGFRQGDHSAFGKTRAKGTPVHVNVGTVGHIDHGHQGLIDELNAYTPKPCDNPALGRGRIMGRPLALNVDPGYKELPRATHSRFTPEQHEGLKKMGEYYSETLDDTERCIELSFSAPVVEDPVVPAIEHIYTH